MDTTESEVDHIARKAAEALGPSTNVTIDSKTNTSRYVQFLLRCDPPGPSDKADGVAEVVTIWANRKRFDLPEPLLVANGEGLNDMRRPVHYMRLVNALHFVGLSTNDVSVPE